MLSFLTVPITVAVEEGSMRTFRRLASMMTLPLIAAGAVVVAFVEEAVVDSVVLAVVVACWRVT